MVHTEVLHNLREHTFALSPIIRSYTLTISFTRRLHSICSDKFHLQPSKGSKPFEGFPDLSLTSDDDRRSTETIAHLAIAVLDKAGEDKSINITTRRASYLGIKLYCTLEG